MKNKTCLKPRDILDADLSYVGIFAPKWVIFFGYWPSAEMVIQWINPKAGWRTSHAFGCFWWLLIINDQGKIWDMTGYVYQKTCEYICLHAHTRTNKCIWLYMRIYFQSCRYKPEIRDPKLYLPESCPCWSFIHWGLFKQYWPTNFVLDLTQGAWMSYINPLIQAWSMVPLHLPLRIIFNIWTICWICWSPDATHPSLHLPRLLSWNWGLELVLID